MNLQQLRSFVTVVDAGSFTAAARRLHVAQPSLSQQIRGLEAELGGELLERLPRALRLTAAGEAFLPKARSAVQAADDAAGLARRALALGPGNLCLAVGPSVPAPLVAAALRRWAGAGDAERRVRWHDHDTQERIEEKARSGVGTVGLGLRPPSWDGPIVEVARAELVVAAPAGDPLAADAAAAPVALGALADRTWIGIDRDRADRDVAGAAFAAAGFLPRELYETSRPDPALRLVAAGLGLALVSRAAAAAAPGVAVVALEDPPARELHAFTDRPWSAPALDFLTVLVSEAAVHDVQADEPVLGVVERLGDRREDLEAE